MGTLDPEDHNYQCPSLITNKIWCIDMLHLLFKRFATGLRNTCSRFIQCRYESDVLRAMKKWCRFLSIYHALFYLAAINHNFYQRVSAASLSLVWRICSLGLDFLRLLSTAKCQSIYLYHNYLQDGAEWYFLVTYIYSFLNLSTLSANIKSWGSMFRNVEFGQQSNAFIFWDEI